MFSCEHACTAFRFVCVFDIHCTGLFRLHFVYLYNTIIHLLVSLSLSPFAFSPITIRIFSHGIAIEFSHACLKSLSIQPPSPYQKVRLDCTIKLQRQMSICSIVLNRLNCKGEKAECLFMFHKRLASHGGTQPNDILAGACFWMKMLGNANLLQCGVPRAYTYPALPLFAYVCKVYFLFQLRCWCVFA